MHTNDKNTSVYYHSILNMGKFAQNTYIGAFEGTEGANQRGTRLDQKGYSPLVRWTEREYPLWFTPWIS
jgi:hypothetical protein